MKITNTESNNIEINSSPKTGSFYNRIVELDPIKVGGAAIIATAAYLSSPIIAGFGLAVIACKMIFDRYTVVVDSSESAQAPIGQTETLVEELIVAKDLLVEIKSSDANERLQALKGLVTEYDNASDERKIESLKAMIAMFKDNDNINGQICQNGYLALGYIQSFIQKGKINDEAKRQATIEGFIAYFNSIDQINCGLIVKDNHQNVLSMALKVVCSLKIEQNSEFTQCLSDLRITLEKNSDAVNLKRQINAILGIEEKPQTQVQLQKINPNAFNVLKGLKK